MAEDTTISPFTNVPQWEEEESSIRENSYLNDVKEFQVGFGSKVMRTDQRGLWLGAEQPGDAPFYVDMDGNIAGSSLTLSNLSGDLDDISDGTTYKRAVQNQLTGGDRAYSGLDSSSEIIKGFLSQNLDTKSIPSGYDGVKLDSDGIYGFQNGNATFYIDTNGDAYFSGDVVSSTITSSTITGGTIQTATTGYRLVMDGSNNAYEFRNDSTLLSQLVSTSVPYSGLGGARFEHGTGTIGIEVSGQGEGLGSRSIVMANSDASNYFGFFDDDFGNYYLVNNVEIDSSWIPYSDKAYNLGSSTKNWDHIYTDAVFVDGTLYTDTISENGSGRVDINDTLNLPLYTTLPAGIAGDMVVYLDSSNDYHLYVYLGGWKEVQTV